MSTTISTLAENEVHSRATLPSDMAGYVCPKCNGALSLAADALRCDSCRRTYPVRNRIPDFICDDLRQSENFSLRHSTWFDWLAPIYETRLWYPVVMRLAGVKGISSLPELLTIVEQATGAVSGHVLDVACGPGTFGRRLAPHAESVYGIDISFGMLEQGSAYALRENVPNMHFARAQVESLPFASGTFAVAVCCGSLHLFADAGLALREIARTMRPGAVFVGFTFADTDSRFSRFSRRHGARLFVTTELSGLLNNAGFEDHSFRVFGSALLWSAHRKGVTR